MQVDGPRMPANTHAYTHRKQTLAHVHTTPTASPGGQKSRNPTTRGRVPSAPAMQGEKGGEQTDKREHVQFFFLGQVDLWEEECN